jgi:hypothetical protein
MPGAIADMSVIGEMATKPREIDIKVYGRASGHILYRYDWRASARCPNRRSARRR